MTSRLVVADFMPIHKARSASGDATTGGRTGSYCDIDFIERYELIGASLIGIISSDAPG